MRVSAEPDKCCGCGACAAVCPRGAIKMEPDALGFPYPSIDLANCTDCGRCANLCAFTHKEAEATEPAAYAVRHKSAAVVAESRSGGMFTAISDLILNEGGVVYGAVFDKDFSVRHGRAETPTERDHMRGSKYIQSRSSDSIPELLSDLKEGRTVLFTGTPCECAALRRITSGGLGEKLYTADVICYGVPSPEVWKAYLDSFGKEIAGAEFRNKKDFGWKDHRETIWFKDGSKKSSRSFTYLFFRHIMLRESCASCPYTNLSRPSDITLGDLWGWEKAAPGRNADDRGLSLVLVNSAKGAGLFERAAADIDSTPVAIGDCLQRPLREPVTTDPDAGSFAEDFKAKGIKYVMRKYGDRRLRPRLEYLYKDLRKTARKILLNK